MKERASQAAIARALRVDPSTISRELKRGTYMHLNSDLTEEERYSPDIAQQNYKRHLSEKGPDVKIGHDHEYAGTLGNGLCGRAKRRFTKNASGSECAENQMGNLNFDGTIILQP